MNINIDYIKQLADAMDEKSIVELALEDNGQKISLKKGAVAHAEAIVPVAEQVAAPVIEEQPAETPQRKATPITSPMVGTFYSSASPEGEPFVRVGDVIRPGQVVCIIEAMKLMNEIESDLDGEIEEILCKDGDMVEFGQPLFKLK